jgi:phosphate starvation-inducible protein PhoH
MKIHKDVSLHVHQRDKLKNQLLIKELNWSDKQKEFLRIALNKEAKLIFLGGPAGTSKTLMAVYASLKLLSDKKVSDIVYLRSAVESADTKLGFLPGTAEEKLHFYNLPFYEKLEELLPQSQLQILEKEKRISAFPINYARGLNWNAKTIILDEAQNSTYKEIITILTRLGHFSKCFILADPMQTDLTNGKVGGFERLQGLFNDELSAKMGIYSFNFGEEDIKRSELVKFIVKKVNNPALKQLH